MFYKKQSLLSSMYCDNFMGLDSDERLKETIAWLLRRVKYQ